MARPIGSKNTKANEIKNMIIHSLDRLGGIEYLVEQAKSNPVAYMGLIGKVLPKDVNMGGQEDNPLTLQHIERRIVDSANTNATSIPALTESSSS